MNTKHRQKNSITENSNASLWDAFTVFYTALFAAVGIALTIHIINAANQQIPMWVLLATGLMLFVAVLLCVKSGDYTGIKAGVIASFGVFFMIWLIPNLSITPGNTPLDQMMMRIFSSFHYMLLVAGIISIISSFAIRAKKER